MMPRRVRGLRRQLAAALLFAALPAAFMSAAWTPALGQTQQPPKLEPLPPPPPPPPGVAADSGQGAIRIGPGASDQVEEIMVDGERGMKVTTPQGGVYYLVPDPADKFGTWRDMVLTFDPKDMPF